HVALEIEHHANHARPVARDPQALDIGVLLGNLALQLGKGRRDVVGLEVEHQALRILEAEQAVLDGRFRLQRKARVVARRPDAAREDLRVRIPYGNNGKEESQALPASVWALAWARRASPSKRR